MNQRGIGVSNLPNVKYRSFCRAGIDFNIMVAGANGLGKSTFINNMLGVKVLSTDPFVEPFDNTDESQIVEVTNYNGDSDKHGHRNALLNFQISKFFVMENGFQTRVTVTEVDGIGDNCCNEGCWVPVVELIEHNYGDYMKQEHNNVRTLIKDRRIHVCLYFIEPSPAFLKTADTRTMKEISAICNLIPIVGKSDLLSDVQKQECYNRIVETLAMENIETFVLNANKNEDVMRGPFFVVSGEMASDGVKYERTYPWGTAASSAMANNDFDSLTRALISRNLIHLVEKTEGFYDDYRTREIGSTLYDTEMLNPEDKLLTKEICRKIKEDERVVRELRQKIYEKKRAYETRLSAQNEMAQ
jgi:septin 7